MSVRQDTQQQPVSNASLATIQLSVRLLALHAPSSAQIATSAQTALSVNYARSDTLETLVRYVPPDTREQTVQLAQSDIIPTQDFV
jgi:hypothetical protein